MVGVLVCFSVAVMKHDPKQHDRGLIWLTHPGSSPCPGESGCRSGEEMKQKSQITRLSHSLWMVLNLLSEQLPRVAAPTVCWAAHMHHQAWNAPHMCSQADLMEAVPQLRLPQITLGRATLTAEPNQESQLERLLSTFVSTKLLTLPI